MREGRLMNWREESEHLIIAWWAEGSITVVLYKPEERTIEVGGYKFHVETLNDAENFVISLLLGQKTTIPPLHDKGATIVFNESIPRKKPDVWH